MVVVPRCSDTPSDVNNLIAGKRDLRTVLEEKWRAPAGSNGVDIFLWGDVQRSAPVGGRGEAISRLRGFRRKSVDGFYPHQLCDDGIAGAIYSQKFVEYNFCSLRGGGHVSQHCIFHVSPAVSAHRLLCQRGLSLVVGSGGILSPFVSTVVLQHFFGKLSVICIPTS